MEERRGERRGRRSKWRGRREERREEGENGKEGAQAKAGGGGSRPRKGPLPPPLAGQAWGGHWGRGLGGDKEASHQEKWGRERLNGGEGATPSPLPPALAQPWMRLGSGVLKPSAPEGEAC